MMTERDTAGKIMRTLAVLWVFAMALGLSPYTTDPATPIKWLATSSITANTCACTNINCEYIKHNDVMCSSNLYAPHLHQMHHHRL